MHIDKYGNSSHKIKKKTQKELIESKGRRMSLENDRQQTEMSKRVPKIKKEKPRQMEDRDSETDRCGREQKVTE